MKLLVLFCFAGTLLAAQEAPSSPRLNTAASVSAGNRGGVILIDPKERVKDFMQAFELLKREKPALKINIQTSSGMLVNVAEMIASDNNTLMLIKVPFNQGTKYMVVPVEDVQEITYSP